MALSYGLSLIITVIRAPWQHGVQSLRSHLVLHLDSVEEASDTQGMEDGAEVML